MAKFEDLKLPNKIVLFRGFLTYLLNASFATKAYN